MSLIAICGRKRGWILSLKNNNDNLYGCPSTSILSNRFEKKSFSFFNEFKRENHSVSSKETKDKKRIVSMENLYSEEAINVIERKIRSKNVKLINTALNHFKNNLTELTMDPQLGNRDLFGKLVKALNEEQRYRSIRKIESDFLTISQDQTGSKSLQTLVECMKTSDEFHIMEGRIKNNVVDLSKGEFSSLWVEKCIRTIPDEFKSFFYKELSQNIGELSHHAFAYKVIIACIQTPLKRKEKEEVFRDAIIRSLEKIFQIDSIFGDKVIETFLKKAKEEEIGHFIGAVCNNLPTIMKNKETKWLDNLQPSLFSVSHLKSLRTHLLNNIENRKFQPSTHKIIKLCLQRSSKEEQEQIVSYVLHDKVGFLELALCPRGSLVLMDILYYIGEERRRGLLEELKANVVEILKDPSGEKCASALIETLNEKCRVEVKDAIAPHFISLCQNPYGSKFLCNFIKVTYMSSIKFSDLFNNEVAELSKDEFGKNVIIEAILWLQNKNFIFNQLFGSDNDFLSLSRNLHASAVLEKYSSKAKSEEKSKILKLITDHRIELANDNSGETLLNHFLPDLTDITGCITHLSRSAKSVEYLLKTMRDNPNLYQIAKRESLQNSPEICKCKSIDFPT
eukprot:TRINITY_DN3575_c0_g1_i4.p1 TRINITY_DN3575_c0_g1~~TRINITY_DN3575_c0_g1_i4.p1  ORF type:complete len:622 (-),score=111.98 TRINITY_DN3575_c0_g1_i4:516-2381(-)